MNEPRNEGCSVTVALPGLTEGQDKWLRRTNDLGQIKWQGPRGYGRSVYERVMKALEAKGFVTPNAFGEYEITNSGRQAIDR